ncbi:MAG: hypothetical protein KatS3mg078_1047 [Deltaproteobacteria bacterium]|nr:MAG: hypothetical protein KatS3mg078_1047 [Deltaproteobacteria bacterium]
MGYVKDIERYFLTLTGKGIMLSPRDYSMILEWQKKKIPKEAVLQGIRMAFKEKARRGRRGVSLSNCAPFVERVARVWKTGEGGTEEVGRVDQIKTSIIERVEDAIRNERDRRVESVYIHLREKILGIKATEEEFFLAIGEVEEWMYEEFFKRLSDVEREEVLAQAEKLASNRRQFVTEKAFRESLLFFRNLVLKRRYGLIDLA